MLSLKYNMTDLGIARCFLGIEILYEDDGSISITQERYIKGVLRRFGLEFAKPTNRPMDHNLQLDNLNCEDNKADQLYYMSMIGSLIVAR
jgi:hypothetical protein